MKKLLLALGLLLGLAAPAAAQTPCGGVNFVPASGVNCLLEPTAPSYAATSVGLVPASAATDIACITGSATKVVRVQYVAISGTATSLINVPVIITKHVSANTGGTAATSNALPVPYSLDPSNAAATATTTAWTANPTIADSAPGFVDSNVVSFTATGTIAATGGVKFDFSERNFMQAPILRSAAQQVCVNLQASTVSSGVVNVTFKWTELAQ